MNPIPTRNRTLFVLSMALVLFSVPSGAGADATALTGVELQSLDNSWTKVSPTVAGGPGGAFVCAWGLDQLPAGSYDTRVTFHDEVAIDTANTAQGNSDPEISVAYASTGRYVVVWKDGSFSADTGDVIARIYESDGTPVTGPFSVTESTPNHRHPDVSWEADGSAFVVVWSRVDGTNSLKSIRARRFDSSGSPLTSEITLVSEPIGLREMGWPTISHAAGKITVAWNRGTFINSFSEIEVAQLNQTTLAEIVAAADVTVPAGTQQKPELSHAPDGSFVIAWESSPNGDGAGWGTQGRRYDVDANALGAAFVLNTTTAGDQRNVAIGHGSDGGFVVVYKSGNTEAYVQCFDSSGSPVGTELLVPDPGPFFLSTPYLAFDDQDRFLVIWKALRIHSRLFQYNSGATPTEIARTGRARVAPSVFSGTTTFHYELPMPSHLKLDVYDVRGRHVRSLVDEFHPMGTHRLVWNGRGDDGQTVPAGSYFLRAEGGGLNVTKRVIRTR